MKSEKILLVEDDRDLSLIVSETLRGEGYQVACAYDGLAGLRHFLTEGADIVVADVMMPGLDGFSMAREIRKHSQLVPIIFLTAKSTIQDLEEGFSLGANDYLRKPFELRELILRIRALLVRSASVATPRIRQIGRFTLDLSAQTLTIDGRVIEITNIEARILDTLAARKGTSVTATELMNAIWQQADASNRNSLHGYIHKLRRLLSLDPSLQISNQRGFGYTLTTR